MGGWWVVSGGPTNYFVTPNLSWGWVGLWQYIRRYKAHHYLVLWLKWDKKTTFQFYLQLHFWQTGSAADSPDLPVRHRWEAGNALSCPWSSALTRSLAQLFMNKYLELLVPCTGHSTGIDWKTLGSTATTSLDKTWCMCTSLFSHVQGFPSFISSQVVFLPSYGTAYSITQY